MYYYICMYIGISLSPVGRTGQADERPREGGLKNKKLIFTNKLLREFKKEIRKKNLHRAETIYRRLLLDLNNYEGNRKKKIEKKIFSLKAKLLNLKNRITKRRM